MARAIGPRIGKASDRLTSILMKVCGGSAACLAACLAGLLSSHAACHLSLLSPQALQAVCIHFEPATYDAALTAAIRLNKTGDVVGGVHVCFAEGIKLCTKHALNSHVLQAESKKGLKGW